ncbi:MAG TPA: GNVR domain-containing protein, partial [Cryomorphaceae bacterium]|nr:GNVR domain-containing protein [Cryomorphaceae bacterium]
WPIIAASLVFWLAIGVIFQISYPPYYTAKTTVLTEEPKGQDDPSILVTGEPVFKNAEAYYFNNQRIVFASYPLVAEALKRSGMVKYIKSGLLNREVYDSSPFKLELDSTYMSFERFETPYEYPFYVNFTDLNKYTIEGEGEYLEGDGEYYYEGEFQFGEWVTLGQMKFRLIPQDTLMNPNITLKNKLFEDEFGFVLMDLTTQVAEMISKLKVVDQDIESTVFTATLSGVSAPRQLEFLSTLGDAFIANHLDIKTRTLRMALDFLEKEIENTSSLLEDSEDSLKYFKSENAITSIDAEGALLLNQSAQLQDEKIELVVRNKYFSYLEETLRTNDDYSTLISPEAFGITDGLLIRLTQELVDLQQDLKSLEAQGAQDNPAYGQVKNAIEGKRATILRSVEGFKSSNLMKLGDIEKRIREIDASSKEFPKEQSELLKLERRFRINETLYTSLMEKKSNVELSLVSTTSDFRIIEPAHLTTAKPIIPWGPLTITAAVLLGLITGVGILIFMWIFNSGIDSGDDIRRHLPQASLLSEIYYTNIRRPGELEDYPLSTLANQTNGLIYNIGIKKPNASSLGISSYKRGEGKSFTSSMLAVQFAQAGYKVIVIDANRRHPSVAKLFRIAGGHDELNSFDINEINSAIKNTSNENIDVLSLGKVIFNNVEVQSFSELLRSLSSAYDRVIVDTAPISNDARSLAILNATDMPIIITKRNQTDVQDILDLKELYKNGSLKELNCVVTGTFSPKTSLNLRRNPYQKNKKLSFKERIRIIFAKV